MTTSPRSLQTCIEALLQEFLAALEAGDRPRQVDLLEQLKVYASVLEHLGEEPTCDWIIRTLEGLIQVDRELITLRHGVVQEDLGTNTKRDGQRLHKAGRSETT